MANHVFYRSKREGTKVKLEIFDNYFKEAIPVFINSPFFTQILIYDLYAGKGVDDEGEFGTSLNILNSISKYCKDIQKQNKEVYIILNDEYESNTLTNNVEQFLSKCKKHCSLPSCCFNIDKNIIIKDLDASQYFNSIIYPKLIENSKYCDAAKIIYLDPFNFVLNEDMFNKIISLSKTDFICFMPSSMYKRFMGRNVFNDFINKENISFESRRPNETHRVIAEYFDSKVPENKEYYLGHFSINYERNYYGVLFGTNHSLGAEKFQKVCWAIDSIIGEADYNIDRELIYNKQNTLFTEDSIPRKLVDFYSTLEDKILQKEITLNIEAYKFALIKRCLIKHAKEVLEDLIKRKIIRKICLSTSKGIHRCEHQKIILI